MWFFIKSNNGNVSGFITQNWLYRMGHPSVLILSIGYFQSGNAYVYLFCPKSKYITSPERNESTILPEKKTSFRIKQNCGIWWFYRSQYIYYEWQFGLWKTNTPYSFQNEDDATVTVYGDIYRTITTNLFVLVLYGIDVNCVWFQ